MSLEKSNNFLNNDLIKFRKWLILKQKDPKSLLER